MVKGNLECFSCEHAVDSDVIRTLQFSSFLHAGKLAGLDKKMSKSLDAELEAGSSPLELSASPLGPLAESGSRKTLIYLILTLNHIYPDYDFSLLRAHHFSKEEGVAKAEEAVDSHLVEVSKVWSKTPGLGESPFLECLWSSIEEAITLKDCDVYSYKSDLESDPFGTEMGPAVWQFSYFFYNKKLKRILYLSCRAKNKSSAEEESEGQSRDYYEESDGGAEKPFGEMDEV